MGRVADTDSAHYRFKEKEMIHHIFSKLHMTGDYSDLGLIAMLFAGLWLIGTWIINRRRGVR